MRTPDDKHNISKVTAVSVCMEVGGGGLSFTLLVLSAVGGLRAVPGMKLSQCYISNYPHVLTSGFIQDP